MLVGVGWTRSRCIFAVGAGVGITGVGAGGVGGTGVGRP